MDKQRREQILSNLINIQSDNQNEAAVADYIAKLFAPYQDQGVRIERLTYASGRDNLIVTIGSGERTLGLTGHEDVVSAGDLAQWNTDPYHATIKDGRLYGRGACDMKSGLAAIVITMLEMLENHQVPGRIRLLATVGEETGEYGAAQLTKAGYANGLDGLVIAEPSNDLKEVGYTAKGVIDYIVTAHGKGAHASRPWKGVNALDHILEFANLSKERLATLTKEDPVLGPLTHVISVINGGEQINSVPAKAIVKGNIRTIPAYPNQVVYDILNQIINELNTKTDHNLEIRYSFPEEAMPGDKDAPLMKLIEQVHDQVFHEPLTSVGQSGASDGSEFLHAKGNFTIAIIGPGGDTSHQSNEYVELPVFHRSIEFYHELAKAFFKDGGALNG